MTHHRTLAVGGSWVRWQAHLLEGGRDRNRFTGKHQNAPPLTTTDMKQEKAKGACLRAHIAHTKHHATKPAHPPTPMCLGSLSLRYLNRFTDKPQNAPPPNKPKPTSNQVVGVFFFQPPLIIFTVFCFFIIYRYTSCETKKPTFVG